MEQKNRILIVEDDTDINNLLYTALQKAGYETVQAFSGTEARMLFQMDKAGFSLILLDLMLPGISGEEVLAQIRKQGNTPVIVLTAKDGLDEKIGLLTSGADDYITKPFEIQEVLARIQVQLRHMQQEPEHKSVSYKNLELDRERFEVRIAGVLLPKITKQEFAILELLLEHPKQVFSKEEIFEYASCHHGCYTVKEIQDILGISRPTVYELLKKNEFRWIQIGTKYRISKKSFDGWLDKL